MLRSLLLPPETKVGDPDALRSPPGGITPTDPKAGEMEILRSDDAPAIADQNPIILFNGL